MKYSKYQDDIFKWTLHGKGNAVIQAVAGSGKTTTIIKCSEIVPKSCSTLFLAFNTKIAKEIEAKIHKSVKVQTFHAYGLGSFRRTNMQPVIDTEGDKLFSIIDKVLATDKHFRLKEDRLIRTFLETIIPCIKNEFVDYKSEKEIWDLCTKYFIFPQKLDEHVMRVIERIMEIELTEIELSDTPNISFDDMIYYPAKLNSFNCAKYDWVFVDELQDVNRAQFELLKKATHAQSRIIGVGDRSQSIYAFRGADINSMDNFKKFYKAQELPLSICYRCPKQVVRLAQKYVPYIECFDDAIEGSVTSIHIDNLGAIARHMQVGDMVLCRTNAPLVAFAFILKNEYKIQNVVIRGENVGNELATLVTSLAPKDMSDLKEKIQKKDTIIKRKLDLIEEGKYSKENKGYLLTLLDKNDSVMNFARSVSSVNEFKEKVNYEQLIKRQIMQTFSDKRPGIILSSVHRAKGLEAKNVYIIRPDQMPHPRAEGPIEREQEKNLIYVAITRAMEKLTYIEGPVKFDRNCSLLNHQNR